MRLRPRSVRVRLALSFAGALALLLTLFSASVYALVRAHLLRGLADRARQELAVVERTFEGDPEDVSELDEQGLVALYSVSRGDEMARVSPAWTRLGLPAASAMPAGGAETRWRSQDGRSYVIATSEVEVQGEKLTLAAAESEEPVRRSLATLAAILLVGLPVAIAAAFLGGSFLASRLLAPVGAMAEAAGRITEERLSERLPVEDPADEFGRLAIVINQSLARLEEAFERMRRFTSDASHELRTPLTALRSVGEIALRDPLRPEEYRETIASMLEESDRLTRLVEGLLVLTREDSGTYRARFAPLDLGELVREVVDVLRVLAEERGQHLHVSVDGKVVVHGDRTTLRQAVLNLVDNAIKYTPREGAIRVQVHASGDAEAAVEIADSGPGIAPEHRQRIFERFYRIDLDRSRSTGGAGLGLPIARWAIDLHGGTIELETEEGKGSTFGIRLPRRVSGTRPPLGSPSPSLP
jgi:heavy metal sensor kinase